MKQRATDFNLRNVDPQLVLIRNNIRLIQYIIIYNEQIYGDIVTNWR